MKKILLTFVAAICAVSISFAASPVIKYAGEVNVGYAAGGKMRYENTATKSSLHRPFVETIHGVSTNATVAPTEVITLLYWQKINKDIRIFVNFLL